MYNPTEQATAETQAKVFTWIETVLTKFILSVNSEEYIIMGGDFNKHRPKYKELALRLKLVQVVDEGTATHSKGNHLYDIFTNID